MTAAIVTEVQKDGRNEFHHIVRRNDASKIQRHEMVIQSGHCFENLKSSYPNTARNNYMLNSGPTGVCCTVTRSATNSWSQSLQSGTLFYEEQPVAHSSNITYVTIFSIPTTTTHYTYYYYYY
jgi:hypothetical protein